MQGRAHVLGWWPRLRGRADDKRRVQEAAQYGRPHGLAVKWTTTLYSFSVYVALTNIPEGELLTGFAMRSDPNVVFG